MPFCEKCGKEMSSGAVFCRECGATVNSVAADFVSAVQDYESKKGKITSDTVSAPEPPTSISASQRRGAIISAISALIFVACLLYLLTSVQPKMTNYNGSCPTEETVVIEDTGSTGGPRGYNAAPDLTCEKTFVLRNALIVLTCGSFAFIAYGGLLYMKVITVQKK